MSLEDLKRLQQLEEGHEWKPMPKLLGGEVEIGSMSSAAYRLKMQRLHLAARKELGLEETDEAGNYTKPLPEDVAEDIFRRSLAGTAVRNIRKVPVGKGRKYLPSDEDTIVELLGYRRVLDAVSAYLAKRHQDIRELAENVTGKSSAGSPGT